MFFSLFSMILIKTADSRLYPLHNDINKEQLIHVCNFFNVLLLKTSVTCLYTLQ